MFWMPCYAASCSPPPADKNFVTEIRMINKNGLLAIVMMLVLTTGPAFAQTAGAGTITGTLTDQSGAAVPGAIVVVRNTDTGIDRSTVSNDSGLYIATFLQPGHYEVSVSPGVKRRTTALQPARTKLSSAPPRRSILITRN